MTHSEPRGDPPHFAARLVVEPDHVLVVLDGEADLAVVPMLESVVDGRSLASDVDATDLVVDVSGLEFIDCAVVAWLARQRSRGCAVRVRGARGVVARVLDLAGWDGLVEDPG